MRLNFKEHGEGRPLVILHGLFGSLDNWFSLSKAFADRHHVYLVDARNHGRSPHTATHGYPEMVEDLREFFIQQGLRDAIVMGHSMGGRTAMMFAAAHPTMLAKLIVVDMGVKAYPIRHDQLICAMRTLNLDTLRSRREAEERLSQLIKDRAVVQFLGKNIYRQKQVDGSERFAWRFNLDTLERSLDKMGTSVTAGAATPALFLYGTASDHVLPSDIPAISRLFPNAVFSALATGHWVHAEAPKEFVETVKRFID